VFKVSQAGMALGSYLVRSASPSELAGPTLDIGTGSGALALLLRGLGAGSIHATDVCPEAIAAAAENEKLNYSGPRITFEEASLFGCAADGGRLSLVAFNPPGWRTPSLQLRQALKDSGLRDLSLAAMFSGEAVVLDFLERLPARLAPGGRAVIGLNSLSGIKDILSRSQAVRRGTLRVRLVERHNFPLFLYTGEWQAARDALLAEFWQWRDQHGAVFDAGPDGTVTWSYEIAEVTLCSSACEALA
jgi:release factor glutamine methyltransferase